MTVTLTIIHLLVLPSQIFDGTGSDLKLYQGGDFQGIIAQIPYLKNMGGSLLFGSLRLMQIEMKL